MLEILEFKNKIIGKIDADDSSVDFSDTSFVICNNISTYFNL